MKTDSAARLYSEQFLRIVQLQQTQNFSPLRIARADRQPASSSAIAISANPVYWDERWFANYE